MISRPARRTALVASAAALGSVLAGCATGQTAISKKDYAPSDGLLGEIGDLRVQNVLVVAPPAGGDTAVLSMAVADTEAEGEPDRLVAVSVDEAGTARIEGNPEVPTGGSLRVGGSDAPAQVLFEGFDADPGASVSLRLRFQRAGELALQPPVVPASGYYADLMAPTPTPSPAPTSPPAAAPTPTPTSR